MEKQPTDRIYDVVIVGGGIIGAATLYSLARYTNASRIALIEKNKQIGAGVSHRGQNSQTLHFGDIETNYNAEKAKKVKAEAELLAGYLENHEHEGLYQPIQKLVLAIGTKEAKELRERFENITDIFPKLRLIERAKIAQLEPKLVEGRDPETELVALFNPDGHTVDYGKTAQSFVREARQTDTDIDLFFNQKVADVARVDNGWQVKMENGSSLRAKTVLMAVGAASLRFAHKQGLRKNWILLPVAGNFFCAPGQVNGKVYMMQMESIPFAAVHADPAVDNLQETQFGPLAKILPMLERGSYDTVGDFFKLARPRLDALKALLSIGLQPVYLQYMAKQVLYDLPYLGRAAFLREARKIIPNLSYSDLMEKKRHSGIRPQIVDTREKSLSFGEAKIVGENIIFDITPSPGASVSLANAKKNTAELVEFLGESFQFDEEAFGRDHQRSEHT